MLGALLGSRKHLKTIIYAEVIIKKFSKFWHIFEMSKTAQNTIRIYQATKTKF